MIRFKTPALTRFDRFAKAAGLTAVLAAGAPAAAQVSVLLSAASGGAGGNHISRFTPGGAFSSQGRHVVFVSEASDLVSGDTNNAVDVFAYDQVTGAIARVSVTSAGAQGNAGGGFGQFGFLTPGAAVSRDGRFVSFASQSSDLVTGDTNNWADVFRHDRDTDVDGIFDEPGAISTTRVSVSSSGGEGNSYSHWPSSSADGSRVCFVSWANNLVANDTNNVSDAFIRDVASGQTIRVSVSSNGTQADAGVGQAMISADGRYVVFESAATNLVANDNNGAADIFLHDTQSGQTTRVSVSTSGGDPNGASGGAYVSASGRYVAFISAASNLVAGDAGGFFDVFVTDTQAGTTALVSVSSAGAQGNAHSRTCAVSDNGRYVAFVTDATNLGVGTPGYAFLHDRDTDGNGIFDEAGGISTVIGSRLPPGSIPSSSPTAPGQQWVGLSGNGDVVGWGNGQAYAVTFGTADTDGDGLLDVWETNGVDADGDGVIDLMLPAGVNPMHKDLIVEIDAMGVTATSGRLPTQATLNAIVQAFANVPNALVNNPDGLPGVNLWLLVDETNLQLQAFAANAWPTPITPNPPQNTFSFYRNSFKGTAAQRASPNWPNIRAAILLTQRYCLFADSVPGGIGGMGEEPGNDFFVSLGSWPGTSTQGGYTSIGGRPSDQIGVFMHELGHNLNLFHGGNQFDPAPGQRYNGRFNWKPNYHSVMNYTWTIPRGLLAPSWRADFSRATMPTLNEASLNEPAGIGGTPGFQTMFGPPGITGHRRPWLTPACPQTVTPAQAYVDVESGPIDWNRDCLTTAVGVSRDINDPFGQNPGMWTTDQLMGYVDWSNISWTLSGAWFLDNPVDGIVTDDGLNLDLAKALDAMGWAESFDTYNPGDTVNLKGGWETWCSGGSDAMVVPAPAFSPPNALMISFPGATPGPFGSDVVKPFDIDSGKWVLLMQTFVPSGAGGSGYVVGLNQYCEPDNNWSMQILFDEVAGIVRSDLDGGTLPLIRDAWVELRVEIDLDNDRFSEFYGGQPLAENLVWSMNVSGQLGNPGITSIAGLDLFSETIGEMYFDDIVLYPLAGEVCYPDCNGDGALNLADFGCFQTKFALGDPYADCNGDGVLNLADFGCFQTKFALGCP